LIGHTRNQKKGRQAAAQQLTSLNSARQKAGGKARNRRASRLDGWTVSALAVAVLVSLPVLVIAAYIFVPSGGVWSHLAATVLPRYVANTLMLVVGVGIGVLVIGVGTAWLVTMCRFPGRAVFEWALLLPFAVPAYVLAYTYTGLFDFAGPFQSWLRALFGWSRGDYWFPEIRSLGGAIAMLSLVLYPYVYLLARAAFLEQSVCVLEVSRTLGRGPWKGFASVALPLARPGIVAGLSFALIETLNDFGTVDYFAVDTFTTGIYRTWFGLGEPAAAAQLASVLLIIVFSLILAERWSRGAARFHHTTQRYRDLPGYQLRGWRGWAALLACSATVFFGFLLPGAALVSWAADTAATTFSTNIFQYAFNSFILAAVTALVAVTVAVLLTYGMRLRPSSPMRVALRVAGMGYAVPGSVIAVGILLVSTQIDNGIDQWMRSVFGISTGLLFTGTVAGMVFAYLVRFLAISLNSVEASLAKVTPNMDHAARTLGQRPLGMLRRVHAPLMWGSLLTAGMLVFVDVMKELPATIIMRPFNFDTLAIRAYQLASDEQLAAAAGPALGIVVVGIAPVILLSVAIARSRPGHGDG
jgi:iron(III) transport system permease protein